MILNMENMLKILLDKGFTSKEIKISVYNDKRILIELNEPKFIISMDISSQRTQYYYSEHSPYSSRMISKKDLFDKLKEIPGKK